MAKAGKILYLLGATAVLSACASGKGSFETERIESAQADMKSSETQLTDDTSAPRPSEEQLAALMEPSLGVAIKIPLRNRHPQNMESHAKLNANDIETLNDGSLEVPYQAELKSARNGSGWITHTHDGYGETHKRDLKYVRSGYVQDYETSSLIDFGQQIFKQGPNGYVYYRGINPATQLPVNQTVHYRGTWDFVTDAKLGREQGDFSASLNRSPSDLFGATSMHEPTHNQQGQDAEGQPYGIGHSSEFTVDFGAKSLTGRLLKNSTVKNQYQDVVERYTVKATLHGNRFRGTATASDPNHLHFGQHSSALEGGFFGDQAEELAGKFMADDQSLFAVFAAKQAHAIAPTQAAFDARKITVQQQDGLTDIADGRLDTFGNATKLVIDGQSFSLLPTAATGAFTQVLKYQLADDKKLNIDVCCSNLDYTKFGLYFNEGSQNYAYFLTGERTSEDKIAAQTGNVQYKGTWAGTMVSKDNSKVWVSDAAHPDQGGRAILNFDFGAKTFQGGLYGKNSVNPTLTLNGTIERNGFSGTAKTVEGGFNIDPNSTGASAYLNIHAAVNGAFYGPNAQEVGGTVYSNEADQDKVGAVFGAKRQVSVSQP